MLGCHVVVLLFWICMMGLWLGGTSLLDMYDGILSICIYACDFNLILCVMMLSKFYQILVHIYIEMLLKYNGKQGYTHKILKSRGIFARAKLFSLTPLSVVHRIGVE